LIVKWPVALGVGDAAAAAGVAGIAVAGLGVELASGELDCAGCDDALVAPPGVAGPLDEVQPRAPAMKSARVSRAASFGLTQSG
jgi:hypothetical protein